LGADLARAPFEEVIELVRDYGGAQVAKRQVEELVVRPAMRLVAEQSVHKLATRLTPGEKHNRQRMAQVASCKRVSVEAAAVSLGQVGEQSSGKLL
jgi:hypothetical protein